MTKHKCDCCGEKHDRMNIVIECSNCYCNGIVKEIKEIIEKEFEKRDVSLLQNDKKHL